MIPSPEIDMSMLRGSLLNLEGLEFHDLIGLELAGSRERKRRHWRGW